MVLGSAVVVLAGAAVAVVVSGARGQAGAATGVAQAGLPVVEVYRDPTCGCCLAWVEHLRADGFTVRVTESDDLAAIKARHGVPRAAQSCHTGIVDGYVVEGHVPASDVRRLLTERPSIAGLAVPGMPIGSPGMEVEGMSAEPYDVLTFERDRTTGTFARYGR